MWSVEFPVFAAFVEAGFFLEAYFFLSQRYGTSGSFYNLLKTLSLISFPLTSVAADNYLRCARLWEHYCHASHVWLQLCESASSRSAICPRPGSLIREGSCGKVCVLCSLPDVPLSLQLFVRVGPSNNTRGRGPSTSSWGGESTSTLWRQKWRKVGNIPMKTDKQLTRITVLWLTWWLQPLTFYTYMFQNGLPLFHSNLLILLL